MPPDDYVRKKLQYLSAYLGLENDSVRNYCKSFLKFAKAAMPNSSKKLLQPFEEMVDSRQTVSDQILAKAKKLGYTPGEDLPKDAAEKLALFYANKLLDDMEHAKKLIEKHSNV